MPIEFRILGPLELSAQGRLLPPGSQKQRALLGLLLVHANETLSRDRLIEELWAEAAPASVTSALHVYLSRLRRLLASAGADGALVREAHGYRLQVEPDQLDANRFERLVSEGSESLSVGNAAVAAECLRQALALWRGPALADLRSERFAIAAAGRLEERRSSALEQRIEVDLLLGRDRELVAELETLIAEHPYRERLRVQLMLALYRAGRQAEALDVYREARAALADELGLEPGQELKQLEQAILRHDPALRLEQPATPAALQQLRETPASEVGVPREERKVVSVLFADLVAFTAQAEQLDPEDVRTLQDRYWAPVRTEIERYGGTVEKFVGDAVMALFGAPRAHEDDPERAVRAALAIRERARQEGVDLRVAVTTGEALVRLEAQPLAGEGMAAGDVVNAAARLQASAPTNGVLVGERTYRATRHLFEYAPAEPVQAKGKTAPLQAWEALDVRARFGIDVSHQVRAPLVGRERELDVLKDALARVREQRAPQLVTLVGVPGIGKSRLVYELMHLVEADSEIVDWRQGRSLPYGEGVSFWALAEIVKAETGILETDSANGVEAKLAEAVHALILDAPEAEWVTRHLRPLAGLGARAELLSDRSESFAAWRRFFEALADRRPAVIVLEDVHWADDGLLDFVDSLVEWLSDVPLLILATARPELLDRRRGWGGGKANATTLSLPPLAEHETLRLVRSLLERERLQPDFELALVERSAGNALYAEQYAHVWQERRDDERMPLPDTVHGLIAARLDGLSPIEKRLLQNAAVFGKVFWRDALIAIDGVDTETMAGSLLALQRKQFVQRARRSSIESDIEYAFLHVLVRDVAYGQLPRGARSEKHRRAAEWIESLGRPDDHAETLAHHYNTALELTAGPESTIDELAARAVLALIRAGSRALAVNSFRNAARYYERALQLLRDEDPRRPQALFGLARALHATGDERRKEALGQAFAALAADGDTERTAEVETMRAEVAWLEGDRAAVDRHMRNATDQIADRPQSTAKAIVLAAAARFLMLASDHEGAIEAGCEAIEAASAYGPEEAHAQALISVGTARFQSGDPAGRVEVERGLELALAANALAAAARGYQNLTVMIEDFARELKIIDACEEIYLRLGDREGARFSQANRAAHLFALGQWDEALPLLDAFIADCEAGHPHRQENGARRCRGWMRLARGDTDGAIEDTERSLAVARAAREPEILLGTLGDSAYVYVKLGRIDEAHKLARQLLTAHLHAPRLSLDFLLVANKLGLRDAVREAFKDAPAPTHRRGALRLATAEGRFAEAAEIAASTGRNVDAAELRLAAAEALLEHGSAEEARAQLEKALAFYRTIDASHFSRRTEALLSKLDTAEQLPANTIGP